MHFLLKCVSGSVAQCGCSPHRVETVVQQGLLWSLNMVRLELDQVLMRRMKEDDIEVVKVLVKVCRAGSLASTVKSVQKLLKLASFQEGCEGTENRLILHILTRPLCLFMLAIFSSVLRCLVHSFILALAIPVFLLIVFLKITMPRSTGVLGSSRPYWDYVGSSYRGVQDETLQNPYCRISGRAPEIKKVGKQAGYTQLCTADI